MTTPIKIVGGEPGRFSDLEIEDFVALVIAAGEVSTQGLEKRIHGAARLAFLFVGGAFCGVAALKRPEADYRDCVAAKSGVPLPKTDFPYELGYVFVLPSARGRRFSVDLAGEVLVGAEGRGVFATTHTNNLAMQATLTKCGFRAEGKPYPSSLANRKLQLFVRIAGKAK